MLSRWRSRLLWIALAGLLAGACSGGGDPGVSVDALQADVAFGAEEEPEPVTTAESAAPTTTQPAVRAASDGPERKLSFDKAFLAHLPPTASTNRRECPPAAINEFPDETAPLNATAPPTEGVHRWKLEGTQKIAVGDTTSEFPLQGFRDRFVQHVDQASDTDWTFQTVEREFRQEGGGDVLVSTFRVRTDARSRGTSALDVEARTGEPDRGLALVRIERFDAENGNLVGSFSPTPPILYLPLPVLSGEEYSAVGIDPRTGESMQHRAKVVKRERVDACGEIVEGWLVDATQTSSGSVAFTRPYRYIVAPHFGGLIISEYVEGVSPIGTYKVTHSIGELEPRPLPEEGEET